MLGEEEDGFSRLRDKPPEIKTLSDRFSHLRAWSVDDEDDETGLSAATASGSPTSVLKNKDSDSNNDCFCCSKQLTEEEEASVDANDEEEELHDEIGWSDISKIGDIVLINLEQKKILSSNTSTDKKICVECQYHNESDALYCEECGKKLE